MAYFGSKKTLLIGLKGEKGDTAGSNPNLLINSNFAINQRGQNSYTSTETAIYTVDRFSLVYGTLTKTSTGISISPSTTSCQIRQYIEKPTDFDGKYLVLSFSCNGTVYKSLSEQLDMSNPNTAICTVSLSGIGNLRIRVYNGTAFLQFTLNDANKPTTNFEWVKLEIGEVATTYTPPLIAEELPKCQRYYTKIDISINANKYQLYLYARTQWSFYAPQIFFPVRMRTIPTVILYSKTGQAGYLYNNTQELDQEFVMDYTTDESTRIGNKNGDMAANDAITGYYSADAEIY